jgi:colanic acid biosynthesis glycosyl transferase WcaI
MRILYLSQYFPPESGATQTRAYEMARNFIRLGHQVTMITEVPNHPGGVIWPEFRGKRIIRECMDGIDVIRVWVKASPVKNFRNRMLFYLTYMVGAVLVGILTAKGHYDLLYASSPPLFVGGAALALSYIKRIPLVFEVRDLWPESAVALGEISNPRAIDWATRLEMACYRKSRKVLVVTEGIYRRLVERGIWSEKLILAPNGANTDLFTFRQEGRNRVRAELRLKDLFVAIYAGIHGIAQGLETLVETARMLHSAGETYDPGICILLVGDGPTKALVARLAQEYRLPNLILLPEKPRQEIPDYLSAADIALIPLRNLDLFKGALPSKLFDAWACERPVLLSVDGEARRILETAGGGRYVPPEDPSALAQALIEMKKESNIRQEMGKRGRQFTEEHFSRQAQAEKLIHALETIL